MVDRIIGETLTSKSEKEYSAYYKKMCSTCNKRHMHIRSDLEGTVELECPKCLSTEFLPSNHLDPKLIVKIDQDGDSN